MATTITHFSPDIRRRLDGFVSHVTRGMINYIESHSRRDRIEALEAKTDDELAAMGLTRDRIITHVFRDVIWL